MNELDFDSLPINPNVYVKFGGVRLKDIRMKDGRRTKIITFKFSEIKGTGVLIKELWQPRMGIQFSMDQWLYAMIINEIHDALSGEKLSDKVEVNKKNWRVFYENYIELMEPLTHKECYIKTLPLEKYKKGDGEGKVSISADIASENFICLTPDLTYTVIEKNIAQDFIGGGSNLETQANEPNW